MSRPGGGAGLRDELAVASRGWRWGQRPLAPASALEHLPEREGAAFPTGWARSRAGRAAREVLHRGAFGPLLRSQLDIDVDGLDRLDSTAGPVVFVANHSSHLDAPLLLEALPPSWRRRTAVAAASDYFFGNLWRGVGTALLVGTIPLERRGGRMTSLPTDLLADGWNLVLFPEGTRSTDGWVGKFRPGAAFLALAAGVPVVPVALVGTYAAMPRGRGWPLPGRPTVRVRFGPALRAGEGEQLRDFSARIAAEVARLLDEARTDDWYGSLRRAATGGAPAVGGPTGSRWRRVWATTEPPSAPPTQRVSAWR